MKNSSSIQKNKIKAILIDSGRVLNVPASGHWHIPPNFFTYVEKKKFKEVVSSDKQLAFKKAGEYIDSQNYIINEEEEFKHFIEYYKILSSYLPQLELKDSKIEAIAKDSVYNYNKYIFFKDVFTIIPELSKSYKLAIVSDAWPSLEKVYIKAGLRKYFSSFVISSVKGVTKPHELMYKTALEDLGVAPEESIFIDDSIKNCNGAIKLGIPSLVLCRDWRLFIYNKIVNREYTVIKNLNDVKKLVN